MSEINTTPGTFFGMVNIPDIAEENFCEQGEIINNESKILLATETKALPAARVIVAGLFQLLLETKEGNKLQIKEGRRAYARHSALDKCAKDFAIGVDDKTEGFKACGENFSFAEGKTDNWNVQCGGHGEVRILSQLAKEYEGKLNNGHITFNVDWVNSHGNFKHPCHWCFKTLCAVKKKCNLTIEFCSENNDPIKLEENLCDNKENGWVNFKDKFIVP